MARKRPSGRPPAYVWTGLIGAFTGVWTLMGVISDIDAMPPFYVHCACLVLTLALSVRQILKQRKDPDATSVGSAAVAAMASAFVILLWIGFFVFAGWFQSVVDPR